MRWPWRRGSEQSAGHQREASEEPRPELQIVPEPSPDARAVFEHLVFGHIDERSDWFEAFLAEPELDDLVTRHIAGDLSPAQAARVRAILADG